MGKSNPPLRQESTAGGGLRWSAQAESWWIAQSARPNTSTACATSPEPLDPRLQELLIQFPGAAEPGRQNPPGAVLHPIRPTPKEIPTGDGAYSSDTSETSFDRVTTEIEGRFDHVVLDVSPTAGAVETCESTSQNEEGQPNPEAPVAEIEQSYDANPDEVMGESEVAGEAGETRGDETAGQEAQS